MGLLIFSALGFVVFISLQAVINLMVTTGLVPTKGLCLCIVLFFGFQSSCSHVGAMAGMIAAAKIAGKPFRPIRRDRIPGCTYTEPQIGSVGLTEAQAREKGYEVKVGKFPFAGNSKATIMRSHDGFVKVVSDSKYGEILGVHILGPQATELIAEAVAVMELEGTVEEIMFTIHAHPTLAESLLDAYGAVEGMAINA